MLDACPTMAQVIDLELDELSRDELEGGWRSLCAMMLLRTTNLLTAHALGNNDFVHQKQSALRWLESDTGAITFTTACDSLDLEPAIVRNKMRLHADNRLPWPINNAGQPRRVFGRGPLAWATQSNSNS